MSVTLGRVPGTPADPGVTVGRRHDHAEEDRGSAPSQAPVTAACVRRRPDRFGPRRLGNMQGHV
ncbi:hypothetical protein GCM10012283_05200 [Phycicoccus endophyticus]|nr:hypothetical protein GCM10012283_05200 [Phycicoccus endophyticus]